MGCRGPRVVRKVLSMEEAWHEMLGSQTGGQHSLASRMGPVTFQ